MTSRNSKTKVLELVQQPPSDPTVENAIERLYFLAKVERGLAEAGAGEMVSRSEAKRRLTVE